MELFARPYVWLTYAQDDIEVSIWFRTKFANHNVIIKLRLSSEMDNMGPLLLVRHPKKLKIFI